MDEFNNIDFIPESLLFLLLVLLSFNILIDSLFGIVVVVVVSPAAAALSDGSGVVVAAAVVVSSRVMDLSLELSFVPSNASSSFSSCTTNRIVDWSMTPLSCCIESVDLLSTLLCNEEVDLSVDILPLTTSDGNVDMDLVETKPVVEFGILDVEIPGVFNIETDPASACDIPDAADAWVIPDVVNDDTTGLVIPAEPVASDTSAPPIHSATYSQDLIVPSSAETQTAAVNSRDSNSKSTPAIRLSGTIYPIH